MKYVGDNFASITEELSSALNLKQRISYNVE